MLAGKAVQGGAVAPPFHLRLWQKGGLLRASRLFSVAESSSRLLAAPFLSLFHGSEASTELIQDSTWSSAPWQAAATSPQAGTQRQRGSEGENRSKSRSKVGRNASNSPDFARESSLKSPNVRGLRVDDQELEAPEVPSERQAMVRWCRGALSLFFEGVFLAKGLSQGPRALRDAVHGATARATGEGSEAGFGSRDAFDTWNHVKSHAKEAKSGRAGAKSGGRRRKSVCDA